MPAAGGHPAARAGLLIGALGVALGVALLAAPISISHWRLSPDAIEYLAIANSWVHGAGFVDPVRWNFFLDASAPLPAFAVRAPALSVLAAVPLALGAGVTGVGLAHTIWAALVAGAFALVARRSMSAPTALAAALVIGLSAAWLKASIIVLSEVTGVAAVLLVIATAPGVLRSVPGALVCAVATTLAWTARPQLLALSLAVVVAAAIELGARRALSHRPLWAYVAGVAALVFAMRAVVEALTGWPPYAGYGVAAEIFHASDGFDYQREYVGAWTFARLHADRIAERVLEHGASLLYELFVGPRYHFAGWLLLPGLVHSLWRRGEGALEQRIAALAGVGFAATTLAYFAAFDPWRYPFLTAACSVLAGMAWVDATASRIAASGRLPAYLLRAAPLVISVVLLGALRVPAAAEMAAGSWSAYRTHGTRDGSNSRTDRAVSTLCALIREPGRVASVEPWTVVLRCGQASVRTPPDLVNDALRARFIESEGIRYFLGDSSPIHHWLVTSPALRQVDSVGGFVLYEVRQPTPDPNPWQPPPALACAGREPDCARTVAGLPLLPRGKR